MDAINRRVATETLLEFALESPAQFVFLTPQVRGMGGWGGGVVMAGVAWAWCFPQAIREGPYCPGAALRPTPVLTSSRPLATLTMPCWTAGLPSGSTQDLAGVSAAAKEVGRKRATAGRPGLPQGFPAVRRMPKPRGQQAAADRDKQQ